MCKLLGKGGNIEDIIWFPNFIPTGIVSECHYSGIFESLDFWKAGWPEKFCVRIATNFGVGCTDCLLADTDCQFLMVKQSNFQELDSPAAGLSCRAGSGPISPCAA